MCILLLAVTYPLFSSNSMHAIINISITIVLTVCFSIIINIKQVMILRLQCQNKIRNFNTQAKIIFESINC